MTNDLVKRLRDLATPLCVEAADRIEELEKRLREWATNEETARREALEEAARVCYDMQMGWASDDHLECAAAIRALKEGK